jgi:hypothetical protein
MRSLTPVAVILFAAPHLLLAAPKATDVNLGPAPFTLGESKAAVAKRCPIVSTLPSPTDDDHNVCWLQSAGDESFAVISGPARHPEISGVIRFEGGHLEVISRNEESIDIDAQTARAIEGFIELLASRIVAGKANAEIEYTKSDDPEIQGHSVFIRIGDSGVNLVLSTGMPRHKGLQLEIREVFVASKRP